jgi:hypothetical protein
LKSQLVHYITKKITNKQVETGQTLYIHPELSNIFDETYRHKGLGFINEKYLDIKTRGKTLAIGEKIPYSK